MNLLVDARPLVDPAQGGVSRVARALVMTYAVRFPDDQIICLTTGTQPSTLPQDLLQRSNVTPVHIRVPNKLWSSAAALEIVSLTNIAARKFGRIDHTFLPNIGFAGRQSGPTSLLLHDLSFFLEPRWFSVRSRFWHRAVRARRLITGATHLFSVSETTKRDAIQLLNIPEARMTVLPMGSTIERKETTQPKHDHPTYVLALGARDPRKNAATAIVAVRQLRTEPEFANLELILLGGKPDTHTREPWIRLPHRPTDTELVELYTHAAALLYPSWYEGFGLPLHEAASFGTPCIASTAGALPETAPKGAIFANPAKPHHWVEALRTTLRSPKQQTANLHASWIPAVEVMRQRFIDTHPGLS